MILTSLITVVTVESYSMIVAVLSPITLTAPILGLVFGISGRKKAKNAGAGTAMALTSIVLSSVQLGFYVLAFILLAVFIVSCNMALASCVAAFS